MTDEMVAADWTKEPSTQVDLSQLKGERSEDEIKKLMRVIWEYRHLLSDGHLDFTKTSAPKHPTVCRIVTSVEDPHIQATNRSVSPADLELGRRLIEERLKEGIFENICALCITFHYPQRSVPLTHSEAGDGLISKQSVLGAKLTALLERPKNLGSFKPSHIFCCLATVEYEEDRKLPARQKL